MVKVNHGDIFYLEGARDYIIVHTRQGQLLTLESMKSLESKLPASKFLRIHKSYLIALNQIDFVERNRVSISGNLLPVSYRFREILNRYVTK